MRRNSPRAFEGLEVLLSKSQRAEMHFNNEFSLLNRNADDPAAPTQTHITTGGGGRGDGPNEAAWIEAYIDRANEPIDFGPVKRRIRNRKLSAIEAETLNSERAATKIVAQTARFIPLPPARDPWEDPTNDE